MAIEIPNLDTRNFEEMTLALEREIPKFTPDWDDFNFSDPGITIVEMLVWIGETLAYRANRIPNETYANFLTLLGGASFDEIEKRLASLGPFDPDYREFLEYLKYLQQNQDAPLDVGNMREAAVLFFQAPYLAVTHADFSLLAYQTNRIIPRGEWTVSKAVVVEENETVTVYIAPQSKDWDKNGGGYFETVVSKHSGSRLQFHHHVHAQTFFENNSPEMDRLLTHVTHYLEPRTLLGTAVKVTGVQFQTIEIVVNLYLEPGANLSMRAAEIERTILNWLDPREGGTSGKGWSHNQFPQSDELVSLLLKMPDITRVLDAQITMPQQITGLEPSMVIPVIPHSFTGFPLPKLVLTLNKLQRGRNGR